MYERHRFLTKWLIQLGVTPEVAAEDACRIEHDISPETFACLKRHAGGGGELTLRTEKMTRRTESRPAAFLLA